VAFSIDHISGSFYFTLVIVAFGSAIQNLCHFKTRRIAEAARNWRDATAIIHALIVLIFPPASLNQKLFMRNGLAEEIARSISADSVGIWVTL
jgi:hypothetical protein